MRNNDKTAAAPIVREHQGISVVRDDLFPGGTKARYVRRLFDHAAEVVYASPAEGGAQTALAQCAAEEGKRLAIFTARRRTPHPRALMAERLGAKIVQVAPGYLNAVQARARDYAAATGAFLVPFGADVPGAGEAIAEAARAAGIEPDEVWCAAGSGVLMRGLAQAWPQARRFAVQVGRALKPEDVAGAQIIIHPLAFSQRSKTRDRPPFPSDPHYDAKAWELCAARAGRGKIVFWNVTGPAAVVPLHQ